MALSYHHITVAGAGDNSGDSWANAMSDSDFETHLEGAVVAEDVHFVMDGTYDYTGGDVDFNGRNGTITTPITIIGVKTGTTNEGAAVVYSDWSRDAADRPFFDFGANRLYTGSYCIIRNIDIEAGDTKALFMGGNATVENCKIYNDSGTSGYDALNIGSFSKIIFNEIQSENGHGIECGTAIVKYNYIHGCDNTGYAAISASSTNVIDFNTIAENDIGITSTSRDFFSVANNTFYNNNTDVNETDGNTWCVINNLHEGSNTDGYKWTTQIDTNFFWKNHGNDARCNDMWDLVDETTVFQDYAVSTGDPLFTTPGSDYSLQDASPNIDNGMSSITGD